MQLFVLLTVCVMTILCKGPESGEFRTIDGSHCTWFDLRVSPSELALATACTCKDQHGISQSYGCQYTGQLMDCQTFIDNRRDVLLKLVDQLTSFNSSCEASSLFLQECPHLRMTREMLHQVKSPCIYQNFEKHKEL
jgi:hypothetical protein